MPKAKTLLETGDDGSPVPWATTRRDRVFNQAAALARTDEAFRRDLLAVLEANGNGKRGGMRKPGEYAEILAAFDAAWRILEQTGTRPTIKQAVDMLVAGPFNDRDYDSLTKLVRTLRRQRNTPA